MVYQNEHRGLGFIRPDDGTKDVYVHYTEVMRQEVKRPTLRHTYIHKRWRCLREGERVRFDIMVGWGGKPQARTTHVI